MSINIGSTSISLSIGAKRLRDHDEEGAQTVKGSNLCPSLLSNYDVLGHIIKSVGFSEIRLREVSKQMCSVFDEHRHHLSLSSCPSSALFLHYIKKAPYIKTIELVHNKKDALQLKVSPEFLTTLGRIKGLNELSFVRCSFKDLTVITKFNHLTQLKSLSFSCSGVVSFLRFADLKQLSNLTNLSIHGSSLNEQTVDALSNLKNLKILNLTWLSMQGGAVTIAANFSALQTLNLAGSNLKQASLASLDFLTNLKHLDLSQSSITTSHLSLLTNLRDLEVLNLSNTKVDDSIFKIVESLGNLKTLNLSKVPVEGLYIDHLSTLTALTNLDLSCTMLQDFAATGLALQRHILDLSIAYCHNFSSIGLLFLSPLKNLKRLDMRNCRLNRDLGLKGLEVFSSLTYLNLNAIQGLSSFTLSSLVNLRQLEHLYLSNTKVSDAGLLSLKGLTNLKTLCLAKTLVTDKGLNTLSTITKLNDLITSDTLVEGQFLDRFKRFTDLTRLNLQSTKLTISGIAALSNLYNLTELDLSFNCRLKDDDLSIMPQFSKLRHLSLALLPVSSSLAEKLISFKTLSYLNLWGSTIASEDLMALKAIKTLSVHELIK